MTSKQQVSKVVTDIMVDIIATDNLDLRIRGILGIKNTLEDLLYSIQLDLGEALALKQINENQ